MVAQFRTAFEQRAALWKELGKAQDSIILAKKKLGGKSKTPPRDRGLHLVDVHMSPGRDLTAEDFDEVGDSEDEFFDCKEVPEDLRSLTKWNSMELVPDQENDYSGKTKSTTILLCAHTRTFVYPNMPLMIETR